MRLLFVDRITHAADGFIRGQVRFGVDESWVSPQGGPKGGKRRLAVATGAVSEAVGQLASWLCLRDNDFTARPVFMFVDTIAFDGTLGPETTVELEARIDSRHAEACIFSGTAKAGGKTIVELQRCGGYFMPLEALEDPEVARARYAALTGALAPERTPALALGRGGEGAFDRATLVDALELVPDTTGASQGLGRIKGVKTFAGEAPFYRDHFPRFPVTPIVVINEMIGQVTAGLLPPETRPRLRPLQVSDLKIRAFIKPGDTATTSVSVVARTGEVFDTIAEVAVGGRRLLRGRYRYGLQGDEVWP